MLKFLGSLLVFTIWAFACVFFCLAFDFLSPPDPTVGGFIAILFISFAIWFLGYWLHRVFKLGGGVCWAIAIFMIFITLIMLPDWHGLTVFSGILTIIGFIVLGVIVFVKGRHAAMHAMPPANHLYSTAMPHTPHFPQAPHMGGNVSSTFVSRQQVDRLSYLASVTKDVQVRGQINFLHVAGKQIIDFVDANPHESHKATLFMDVHLPKTVQLLETYTALSYKEVRSRNMDDAMVRIANSIGNMKKTFDHSIDGLYSVMVEDINMDIEIMEQLVNIEGLDI